MKREKVTKPRAISSAAFEPPQARGLDYVDLRTAGRARLYYKIGGDTGYVEVSVSGAGRIEVRTSHGLVRALPKACNVIEVEAWDG